MNDLDALDYDKILIPADKHPVTPRLNCGDTSFFDDWCPRGTDAEVSET
jgi:hypothetical protein